MPNLNARKVSLFIVFKNIMSKTNKIQAIVVIVTSVTNNGWVGKVNVLVLLIPFIITNPAVSISLVDFPWRHLWHVEDIPVTLALIQLSKEQNSCVLLSHNGRIYNHCQNYMLHCCWPLNSKSISSQCLQHVILITSDRSPNVESLTWLSACLRDFLWALAYCKKK